MGHGGPADKRGLPPFGGGYGFIYPLTARALWYATYITPIKTFNLSATATDIVILAFLLIECAIAFLIDPTSWLRFTAYGFVAYRLLDIYVVLSAMLILGFYRSREDWPMRRGLLLVLVNVIEVFFMYGVLFYLLAQDMPTVAKMNIPLDNLWDAVYFSFVTGTTVGYGELHPIGWLARLLAMSESCLFLIVFLNLLAHFKGSAWATVDADKSVDKTNEHQY